MTDQQLQATCGGFPLMVTMDGKKVCGDPRNLASAYYVYTDVGIQMLTEQGKNNCPDGMRPGIMHIKGIPATENNPEGYLNTCSGKIDQQDMPDMNIVDWDWRILTDSVLVLAAGILLLAIILKLLR